ncbi:MAG: hypoxanthine phosphoribosyltransferase [Bacteroidales bacterium]|nr:hypoxanthine phosphoribosyltransferase [Bacteroidales bacterium]
MERIQLHDKYFKPFIPNIKIEEAIEKVAQQLNNDYKNGETPIFLSVLNGSFMFTASLMGKLEFNCEISFVKLASYSGTESSGCINKIIGLSDRVKGRKVVIIEDIVDTGNTIEELVRLLNEMEVADIKICTLFLKPGAYKKEIPIDYPAMEIGNEFIVGFGLDYDQLGRQYKDIYIID